MAPGAPARVIAVALAAAALAAGTTADNAVRRHSALLAASGSYLYRLDPERRSRTRLVIGSSPDWSPDGSQLAFTRAGDIYVANADGSGVRRLTETAETEGDPDWSPDGIRIAYSRERSLRGGARDVEIWTIAPDGRDPRRLVSSDGEDRSPAWSFDGRRLAFVSSRDGDDELYAARADGLGQRRLTDSPGEDADPAWSPGGDRLAFSSRREGNWEIYVVSLRGGDALNITFHSADDNRPAWSPSGRRLAFSSARGDRRAIYSADPLGSRVLRLGPGDRPDWRRVPAARELLPDLDQRAPERVSLSFLGGRTLLAFASAADNVGEGPAWVRGRRAERRMTAEQLVPLSDGRTRRLRNVGVIRYTSSPTHVHWHLLDFMRYELRRARDFSLVGRDRKSGFCLADHYGHAAHRVRIVRPRFLGNCASGRPDAGTVEQGTSVGYTDRYPPHFHGQYIDVTRVPPGRYVLVHRANPALRLRERSYANNAASVLLRLEGSTVRVLAVCEGSEHCPPAR